MKPSELLKSKLSEIQTLMLRPDISEKFENLRVFGSVAENTDTEESDIDFLITRKYLFGYMPQIRLQMELEKILGIEIDLVSDESLNYFMKQTITKTISII